MIGIELFLDKMPITVNATISNAALRMSPCKRTGTPVHSAERQELIPVVAPMQVSNFIDLAKSGFYDGTHIHRVVEDEYIFGGCPLSTDLTNPKSGTGGPTPASTFPNLGVCSKTSECVIGDTLKRNADGGIDEEQMPANAPLNLAGTISMGRASKKGKPTLPATDGMWGSLFFFNVVDHPPLNEKFPVFGKVSRHMNSSHRWSHTHLA